MTIAEAKAALRAFYRKSNPTEDECFLFTEALDYLIEATKEPHYMTELGGYYYDLRNFELARKYYELAAEYGDMSAIVGLGYIFYYGRTGEPDYEKAFYYYSMAAEKGHLVCEYKVADMYKNGYYVAKDYDKYVSIIESLYPKIKNAENPGAPLPEIFTRLAAIRTEQGRTEEAVRLYLDARYVLAQRIVYNAFFGNLTIMKYLIRNLYDLTAYPAEEPELYDHYYLLGKPGRGQFSFDGQVQTILSERQEDGSCAVCFNGKWYRTIDDFFAKACIGCARLTALYDCLYDFDWTAEEEA